MDPITIFGITVTVESLLFFALFLISEVIGSNPRLAENTVGGLFLNLVKYLAVGRKEDDKVKKIRDILRQ